MFGSDGEARRGGKRIRHQGEGGGRRVEEVFGGDGAARRGGGKEGGRISVTKGRREEARGRGGGGGSRGRR